MLYVEPRSLTPRVGPGRCRYIVFHLFIVINQTLGERNKASSAVDEFAQHFPPDADATKGLNTKSSQIHPFVIVWTGTSDINTEIPEHVNFTAQNLKYRML